MVKTDQKMDKVNILATYKIKETLLKVNFLSWHGMEKAKNMPTSKS